MKKFTVCFLLLLAVVISSQEAYSYGQFSNVEDPNYMPQVIQFQKWKNLPVKFKVDGGSLGSEDGVKMVKSAIATWNNVPKAKQVCDEPEIDKVDYTLDNIGTAFANGFDPQHNETADNTPEIVFDADGSIIAAFVGDAEGTLGIGLSVYNTDTGEIIDALLLINGSYPSSAGADLQATIVHEMGHILGLTHSTVGAQNSSVDEAIGFEPIDPEYVPTMWYNSINPNDAYGRTLALDDMLGLINIYPE